MKSLTRKQMSQAMRQIGKRGGIARKHALTPERRSEIARKAALARYAKL